MHKHGAWCTEYTHSGEKHFTPQSRKKGVCQSPWLGTREAPMVKGSTLFLFFLDLSFHLGLSSLTRLALCLQPTSNRPFMTSQRKKSGASEGVWWRVWDALLFNVMWDLQWRRPSCLVGSKTERENDSNTNKVRKSEDTRRLCRTYDYKNVKDGAKDPDPKYLIITISKIVVPAAIWYYNLFF